MLHSDTESSDSDLDDPINKDFSVNYEENDTNMIIFTYNCKIYLSISVLFLCGMTIIITVFYFMFTLN